VEKISSLDLRSIRNDEHFEFFTEFITLANSTGRAALLRARPPKSPKGELSLRSTPVLLLDLMRPLRDTIIGLRYGKGSVRIRIHRIKG
jgi:hypothetical protein